MPDMIPTDRAEIIEEINALLEETPLTTDRGRLFHLINALAAMGGTGGSSFAPAVEVGSYNIVNSASNVPDGGLFLDIDQLIFNLEDTTGTRVSDSFEARTHIHDFDFYVVATFGGLGTSVIFVESESLILGDSSNDRAYVNYRSEFPMLPPFPDGSTAVLYAVPKPQGATNRHAPGLSLAFKAEILGVDSSSPSDFDSDFPSAVNGQGALNNASTASFSTITLHTDVELWNRINLFNGAGMYGNGASVCVVLYQNGAFVASVCGTGAGGSNYDNARNVMALMLSNRNQSSTVTLNPANGVIEARVFVNFAA